MQICKRGLAPDKCALGTFLRGKAKILFVAPENTGAGLDRGAREHVVQVDHLVKKESGREIKRVYGTKKV